MKPGTQIHKDKLPLDLAMCPFVGIEGDAHGPYLPGIAPPTETVRIPFAGGRFNGGACMSDSTGKRGGSREGAGPKKKWPAHNIDAAIEKLDKN